MTDYNYSYWLSTHKKKSVLEKLERSLVPFALFAQMPLASMAEGDNCDVYANGNGYACSLISRTEAGDRVVCLVRISRASIADPWSDVLMGYSDFKVIMQGDSIVTIYPDGEEYFANVVEMFERGDFGPLLKRRTVYLKNLLARYILLDIISRSKPNLSVLYTAWADGLMVPVLAGNADAEWIMYAFEKEDANKLAMCLADKCRKLTVVYFIDSNFERSDLNGYFLHPSAQVVSIKAFYRRLNLSADDRSWLERRILFLIEMLYGSRLVWDQQKLLAAIGNAPKMSDRNAQWMPLPKMLVEDALNVLAEDYNNPLDIFHLLCAANLINAYTNTCKSRQNAQGGKIDALAKRRMKAMYAFKSAVVDALLKVYRGKRKCLSLAFCGAEGTHDFALLANITIGDRRYQFKFRGLMEAKIAKLRSVGVSGNGVMCPTRLQPVAPALYLYSYLLKWGGAA